MLLKSSALGVKQGLILATRRLPAHQQVYFQSRSISIVPEILSQAVDVNTFKSDAFDSQKPLVLRGAAVSLPAITKWFTNIQGKTVLSSYLKPYSHLIFPYELATTGSGAGEFQKFLSWLAESPHSAPELPQAVVLAIQNHVCKQMDNAQPDELRFMRFSLPLALLDAALRFSQETNSAQQVQNLYIAQAELAHIFDAELANDVPVPELVKAAGKGDVYSSSLWMGLEPTFTPWHRDPNPNFFCQMCSSKAVRLMPPNRGKALFSQAMAKIATSGPVSSRIRGEEMMQGAQRTALLEAVWGEDAPHTIQQAVLGPGDALFIPNGWWHSLKSGGNEGGLNASVNWWFR